MPVGAGARHAVLRDQPVDGGPAHLAAPAWTADKLRIGMQVVEGLLHPEFPASKVFHCLALLIGRRRDRPGLSRLVEILLCELAIELVALRTVSLGQGEILRLHLVFLHECRQLAPFGRCVLVGPIIPNAPAKLALCGSGVHGPDLHGF